MNIFAPTEDVGPAPNNVDELKQLIRNHNVPCTCREPTCMPEAYSNPGRYAVCSGFDRHGCNPNFLPGPEHVKG
jgi:hypothetical protein